MLELFIVPEDLHLRILLAPPDLLIIPPHSVAPIRVPLKEQSNTLPLDAFSMPEAADLKLLRIPVTCTLVRVPLELELPEIPAHDLLPLA